MGFIELLKEIGNRLKSAAVVTFSSQDFVGEDAIENVELAVLTTPKVSNKDGSELIQKLREVERKNKKGKTAEKTKKTLFGKGKSKANSGKGGKGMSQTVIQDTTMKTIRDGVTSSGKYNKNSAQTQNLVNNEGMEHDDLV